MTHFVNLFDLQNEIKRMEAMPIGCTKEHNKPLAIASSEKTITVDLDNTKYRNLIIDVYSVDILNQLLTNTNSIEGTHSEGGRYRFDHVDKNIWNVTEYILD